jgi:CDP-4-dehydro-6-deoxyglucose reductase
VLSDEERVEGICVSCRAVPITNVVIELQEGDKLRRVLPLGFASGSVVKFRAGA